MHCLVVVAAFAWPRPSPGSPLQADTAASRLVIRTTKHGLLSAFAHDHEFTPERWRAQVELDPGRPQELRVDV